MRHISAVVLIVLLVALPSCRFFKREARKDKALAVLLARQDSIRVADSIKKVQDRIRALEDAKIDSLRLAEEKRKAMETRYNIIVGSFITPEYAQGLAEEYRNLGYDAKIIKQEDSKFELVAAEGHKSFKTAVSRLNAFQDTVQINAWMYIRK